MRAAAPHITRQQTRVHHVMNVSLADAAQTLTKEGNGPINERPCSPGGRFDPKYARTALCFSQNLTISEITIVTPMATEIIFEAI